MPSSTSKLGLRKINTSTDGNLTVNIETDFNANWDKIDTFASQTELNYTRSPGFAVATGSANAYAVTLSPAPTSYVSGMGVSVQINIANTGASTINVNSLGAKSIKKANGNDVSSGNLKSGSIYTLRYNGTNFILQGEGGEYGTATAPQVLSGYSIGTDSGLVSGTMANYSTGYANAQDGADVVGVAANDTVGRFDLNVPDGYHTQINAHILGATPANIKAGAKLGHPTDSTKQIVGTFTSDATASQYTILNGYNAYINGNKVNGAMANYSGAWQSGQSAAGAAGRIYIYPWGGFYDYSTAGYGIYYDDANFTPANIKNGVTILGLTGTGPSLKMAKMTATGPASWSNYIVDLNFSGMAFTPEFAAVYYDGPIYKSGAFTGVTTPLLATNDTTTYISGGANDLYATNVQNGTQVGLYASLVNVVYGSCTVRISASTTTTGITGSGNFTILFFGK